MTVQAGLCRACSETTLLVFPRGGSLIDNSSMSIFDDLLKFFSVFDGFEIVRNLYFCAILYLQKILKDIATYYFKK